MDSAASLGVFDMDWDSLIKDLEKQSAGTVAPHSGLGYDDKGELETVTKPEDLAATKSAWSNAGYKKVSEGGSAEWYMYYPSINFDESLVKDYMSFLGVQEINACWISMVKPGYCCPWHIDQHELRSFQKKRFHTHIGKPQMGHVFMTSIKNKALHSCGMVRFYGMQASTAAEKQNGCSILYSVLN
jgi:hypothetical protein